MFFPNDILSLCNLRNNSLLRFLFSRPSVTGKIVPALTGGQITFGSSHSFDVGFTCNTFIY